MWYDTELHYATATLGHGICRPRFKGMVGSSKLMEGTNLIYSTTLPPPEDKKAKKAAAAAKKKGGGGGKEKDGGAVSTSSSATGAGIRKGGGGGSNSGGKPKARPKTKAKLHPEEEKARYTAMQ